MRNGLFSSIHKLIESGKHTSVSIGFDNPHILRRPTNLHQTLRIILNNSHCRSIHMQHHLLNFFAVYQHN
jgi:hypothetical protein